MPCGSEGRAAPENAAPPLAAGLPSDLHELGEIIRAYSEATAELQRSHQLLQRQVRQLSGELSRKNLELSETVTQVSALKNYLAGIIDSSADGIVAIDLERRVMAWNPAADILGEIDPGVPENPDGMFILDVLPGPCREMGVMLMRSLRNEERMAAAEMRFVDRSGRHRFFSVSSSPVRSSDAGEPGGTVGAVQIFSDLTALRELEERLNRRDRLAALGEMAAGVAHEIRNPLGGIELYASSLGRKFPEGSQERSTCKKIMAAAASLNRIVTDMLTFTRGRQPRLRPASLLQVARQGLELAARELEERGIRAELDIEDESRRRRLDPDQMAQAALNVILNAAQAIGAGGTIRISSSEAQMPGGGKSLRLSFADDGPGIPDDAKGKIFDPFFTLRQDGTGLGLAIVHKIVHDHGGAITVEDNKPRGTVVTFVLPA